MDLNRSTYQSDDVISWYDQLHEITSAEKNILALNQELFQKARLLDIGIGGGRTTSWLSKICRAYTGIDYSSSFAGLCQKKFPHLRILEMDARDMTAFRDASFDIVNFSFNGIDYVNEEGRKKIFSEIKRVLAPGGFFFFSTHNKSHPTFNVPLWQHPGQSAMVKLKTFVKLLPSILLNKRKKKLETHRTDYAIINDSAHNYRLLTFYTSPAFLRKQLHEAGFGEIRLYSKKGEPVPDEKLDDWIFVTCFAAST